MNTTLWTDCLYEAIEIARREGRDAVEFAEVEKIVVDKSHILVSEGGGAYREKAELAAPLDFNPPPSTDGERP